MQSSASLSALAFAVSWLALAPVANAQNQQNQSAPSAPSTTTPEQSKPQANIPDDKLDAAAAAMKSVSTVKQDYVQRLAKAPDADKPRLVNEANQAMSKAVTDQGLSIAEYSAILEVAQNDQAVRDKLLARLK
jgi:hypothetical protein